MELPFLQQPAKSQASYGATVKSSDRPRADTQEGEEDFSATFAREEADAETEPRAERAAEATAEPKQAPKAADESDARTEKMPPPEVTGTDDTAIFEDADGVLTDGSEPQAGATAKTAGAETAPVAGRASVPDARNTTELAFRQRLTQQHDTTRPAVSDKAADGDLRRNVPQTDKAPRQPGAVASETVRKSGEKVAAAGVGSSVNLRKEVKVAEPGGKEVTKQRSGDTIWTLSDVQQGAAKTTKPLVGPEPQTIAQMAPASRTEKGDKFAGEITLPPSGPEKRAPQMPATPAAANVANFQSASEIKNIKLVEGASFDLTAAADADAEVSFGKELRPSAPASASAILARAETPTMVARQMAQALQKLPNQPVELALSPKELGKVKLSISTSEAGISVSVVAERQETLDLMRRNIQDLAREFHDIGYGSVNFAFSEGKSGADSGFEGEHGSAPAALEIIDDASAETIDISAQLPVEGLDLRL